jgi:hypothetical protein
MKIFINIFEKAYKIKRFDKVGSSVTRLSGLRFQPRLFLPEVSNVCARHVGLYTSLLI